MLSLGLEKISVSIESPDPKAFREIRGGKLEKVVRNLRHLMEQRRVRGLDRPVVGFSITVLERTRHELPEILELYRSIGLDGGISLQPLQRMEAYAKHYPEDMRTQFLSDDTVERLWLSFIADADVRDVQNSRSSVLGYFDELLVDWRPAQRTCPYLEQSLYVHRDGAVTACCMIKDTKRFALGRVGEDNAEAIIEEREKMRQTLAGGELPTPCEGCEVGRMALMGKGELVRFWSQGMWNRWFPRSEKSSESATLG